MNNKSIAIESETDWARLDAMTDADINLYDCPEVTPVGLWCEDLFTIELK